MSDSNELYRLAEIGRRWESDSSLETWFPLSAERLKTLTDERDHYMTEMYRALEELRKLRKTL